MNVEQIMNEIRKLSRIERTEIHTWLATEIEEDSSSRIGLSRSLAIRREIEQTPKASNPRRGAISSSNE
jgi:hypothetical protein